MDESGKKFEEVSSLETPSTTLEAPSSSATADSESLETPVATDPNQSVDAGTGPKKPPKMPFSVKFARIARRFNIYLIGFFLMITIGGVVVYVAVQRNRQAKSEAPISTQELTQETIDQLKNTDAKVGDPKQILTIESNTVISGQVLIRDSLDVAGPLKVGGALSLPGITVSGVSNFEQVQASSLSIGGDASVQGSLTVLKGLNVSGAGSFSGPISAPQISIDTLLLNRDIQLNRHIDAGGSTPTKSDGAALGNGGTTSLSGTDTAGTVTINTGSSPPAGCFINITFAQKFNANPHVVISPTSSDAASVSYYVNRSTTGFSICAASGQTSGKAYVFDYIVID
jgi:cytoskeletal protein CcmA (bactofilin family)